MTDYNNKKKKPKKENKKKKIKINYKKTALYALKAALILGVLLVVFGASAAFGMVVASLRDVPSFDPAKLEATLPSKIKDQNGELIARLDRDQYRENISIDEVPDHVIEAFVAIEDSNYFNHIGFDIRGIMRAAYINLRETGSPFGGLHGGSTITQQLVKNAFLTPDQHLERKIQEVWLSLQVERSFTKDEIMELYLNNAVYFNHNAYGVQAASQIYFDKNVDELEVEEAALLAGIIRHPSRLSPHKNPEAARQRQRTVLNSMEAQGFINEEEYTSVVDRELDDMLTDLPERQYPHPHYLDYVIHNEVIPILKENNDEIAENDDETHDTRAEAEQMLYQGGLTIYTNMDRDLQRQIEEVMDNNDYYPFTTEGEAPQPQSAGVISDPSTGEIKALFGGRAYGPGNMTNRVTSKTLEPGSALKPVIVYGPAFEERKLSPGSVIDDVPSIWDDGGGYFIPENFSRVFSGLVTVRDALTRSLNVPAVKAFEDLGKAVGIEYGQKLGLSTLTSGDKNNLAAAIGGLDKGVNPIDMAQAYGTFANEGIKVEPYAVSRIDDMHGEVLYESNPEKEVVISAETAWLITDILQDVTSHGTASSLNDDVLPVAAKTGTSQGSKDGWLVSYTQDRVISVWMGFDRGGQYISSVTAYPLRMTNQLLEPAHEGIEPSEFTRPDGIEGPIEISSKSGLIPSDLTPEEYITHDYFMSNMIPTHEDDAFVEKEICVESEKLVGDFCPEYTIEKGVFLEREPYVVTDGRWDSHTTPQDSYLEPPEQECDVHIERPGSPLGVNLVLIDDDIIRITWLAPYDEDIESYNIYRKSPEDDEFSLLEGGVKEREFEDEDASPGENYAYIVRAVDEGGVESSPSRVVSVGEEEREDEEDNEQEDNNNDDENDDENEEDEEDKEKENEEDNEE